MKITFTASQTALAQDTLKTLIELYGQSSMAEADCVVAIGGDGMVLRTLYSLTDPKTPVFALRRTDAIGFLCNNYQPSHLHERITAAQQVKLHPLQSETTLKDGSTMKALAFNEVALLRTSPQSAKLRIMVDGIERIAKYSGDGLLVATPAGSTAYNHSAGGPIMPLDANTLVMTAICGFRPRRWSYAILRQNVVIDVEVLEVDKRPVRIEAGTLSAEHVLKTRIRLNRDIAYSLLFDPDQHLGERIVQEQFMG